MESAPITEVLIQRPIRWKPTVANLKKTLKWSTATCVAYKVYVSTEYRRVIRPLTVRPPETGEGPLYVNSGHEQMLDSTKPSKAKGGVEKGKILVVFTSSLLPISRRAR